MEVNFSSLPLPGRCYREGSSPDALTSSHFWRCRRRRRRWPGRGDWRGGDAARSEMKFWEQKNVDGARKSGSWRHSHCPFFTLTSSIQNILRATATPAKAKEEAKEEESASVRPNCQISDDERPPVFVFLPEKFFRLLSKIQAVYESFITVSFLLRRRRHLKIL